MIKLKQNMYNNVLCPVNGVREKEHNGKDAVTTQNLLKLEAGLQFKKRDYRSNNMGLNCLRVCPLLK